MLILELPISNDRKWTRNEWREILSYQMHIPKDAIAWGIIDTLWVDLVKWKTKLSE